jgi:hypothetical protein
MDCTLHATVAGANAALVLSCRVARGHTARPPHWRARAVRSQGTPPEQNHLQPPTVKAGGGRSTPPKTARSVAAGVALALALALGGASWTARSGSDGNVMHLRPAAVCVLNAVTDGASTGRTGSAAVRTSADALSDSLFRRDDSPRDRATLMDLVFEQVTKEVRFYSPAAFVDGLICYGYVLFIWT